MNTDLKSRALTALFWSSCERLGQQGVQFVISIILARLLVPEAFGLIGLLTLFMALAQSFLDGGFGSGLIQKRDATATDTSSVFYFNVVIGFVAAGLFCLAAPSIATFFNQPLLTPLARFLSLSVVINSFGVIQMTLLIREIDFRTQARISVLTSLVAGPIGVGLAYNGFGVWSLAIQQVCGNLCRTILLWVFSTWRPSLLFSFAALGAMFGFGSRMLASGLLNAMFESSYLIVIGRVYSPTSVGFYSRALSFQELASSSVSVMVSRVTFPLFSTIQSDVSRLKRGVKQALIALAFVNFPISIGLAVVSRPLVTVLLSDKWLPCVPYLQLLSIVGLMYPLHSVNLNLLKALGRADLLLNLELIKKVLMLLNIIVTWRFGIEAMIYGQLVLTVGCYYMNSYYSNILIGYSLREQLWDLLPALAFAVLMGIGVYTVGYLPFASAWLMLISQIIGGVVIYVGLMFVLRVSTFVECLDYARYRLRMY